MCQRSAIGRRKSSGSKCNGSVNDTSRGRCKVGSSAPGFLGNKELTNCYHYHTYLLTLLDIATTHQQ